MGDRVVVETVSGMRSEGLVLLPGLCDEGALSYLAHAVVEASEIRHPALRNPRRLERLTGPARGAVLVSDYVPGLRLAAWLDGRCGQPPATGTILFVAKHVLNALAALSTHTPAMHHGALGLDRIILAADGRVLVAEAGLGLLLGRVPGLDSATRWSTYRAASPLIPVADSGGQCTDVCQLGIIVVELLLGRRLTAAEYPGSLASLLGTVEETDFLGHRAPLGGALFEWVSLLLGLDTSRGTPSIALAAQTLDELLTDESGYVAAPLGLDIETESLESFPFPPPQMPPSPALPPLPPQGSWSTGQTDVSRTVPFPTPRTDGAIEPPTEPFRESEGPVRIVAGTAALAVAVEPEAAPEQFVPPITLRPDERLSEPAGTIYQSGEPSSPSSSPVERGFFGTGRNESRAHLSPLRVKRHWRTMLPWGGAAIVLTLLVAGGAAVWRHWMERTVGQATSTLNVSSQPEGATILIDGIERGKAPLSVAVPPGPHLITAK
ncbi:MAG: PEGA domain-containing protein [Vicinamibacterales bacterium]